MSWYDLDEVLAKADLLEVARWLGMNVERRGAINVALCPFHTDTKPSLVLYPGSPGDPPHFHCFSCNHHGYAVDLVKQLRSVDFKPAIEWLAGNLGIQPKEIPTKRGNASNGPDDDGITFAMRVFDEDHDESDFAEWCRSRKLDRDFLYGQGIRLMPAGFALVRALKNEGFGRQRELIDELLSLGLLVPLRSELKNTQQGSLDLRDQVRDYFFDSRVLIPIRTESNGLAGFAGRHRPTHVQSHAPDRATAKYLLTPGLRKADVLFNAYEAKQALGSGPLRGDQSPVLYVVEGFLDALRLQSMHLPAVATMGTSLSANQREILINIAGAKLSAGAHTKIRVFFDRDKAGFEGANRVCRQLLGVPGIETEWLAFADDDSLPGKDPDEILGSLERDDVEDFLNERAVPAIGIMLAASLGYKDASPLTPDQRWQEISRYPRERALIQAKRALRALSGTTTDWAARLESHTKPHPRWIVDLLALLRPSPESDKRSSALDYAFLNQQEARFNHARMLAEHGSRRGELPCDEETWRALDRNAQVFNELAAYRVRQPGWEQVAPCDAVHLPRKLTADEESLNDPRRKVMPHPADLHLQQVLMNELLTERHDFSHEGPRNFSDCIPAVRWFATERETRVTGYVEGGKPTPWNDGAKDEHEEETLSFAYQVDMEVVEGRRNPTDQGMFRPYIDCWRDYMSSLGRQSKGIGAHVHVLRLDAKRYYDSIQQHIVRDALLTPIEQALTIGGTETFQALLGRSNNDAHEIAAQLVDLLCGSLFGHAYWHPDKGSTRRSEDIMGIPQGPVISAWIGTIAMFPVDAAARAFMQQPRHRHPETPARPSVGYARYVDDIVLLADSEERLDALRQVVQAAAASLDIVLVRKGQPVIAGSPDLVMQQLNSGRALAPSVPVWEPPIVGDGETGWAMSVDDVGPADRQSSLHLLRHPSLLEDVATVHEKVRQAMHAPDLRPSDLGKCARALWWQIARQSADLSVLPGELEWERLWLAYRKLWDEVCTGHAWAPAFERRAYDTLFSIEGLDMLMDFGLAIENGRPKTWIKPHREALDRLAAAVLLSDDVLQHASLSRNKSHIRGRARKVQWKALQRVQGFKIAPHVDSQAVTSLTLTAWFCLAAILLNRYHLEGGAKQVPPLTPLPDDFDAMASDGPLEIQAACSVLKPLARNIAPYGSVEALASKIALQFLVANTTVSAQSSRWDVLRHYPLLIGQELPELERLFVLPPLPVQGAGMLAYVQATDQSQIHLFAFSAEHDAKLPKSFVGASTADGSTGSVPPITVQWGHHKKLVHGLHRFQTEQTIGLTFDIPRPKNRARFAAELFEILHAIQLQSAGDGNEWVMVTAHLAHEGPDACNLSASDCRWYLVAEPIAKTHLGVSAWVRDGRGGLRGVSVPAGDYANVWRLGCAVSDALEMMGERPNSAEMDEEDALAHPQQIEAYLLRQQLSKLRGLWISDAQVYERGDDSLPKTVHRSLDILRQFDPELSTAAQVKLVFQTETETRSMAMRLERKGPSDLRNRLHLLPSLVLKRLPLSVLQCLPLPRDNHKSWARADLALLLDLAAALDTEDVEHSEVGTSGAQPLGSPQALHIAIALAATGTALHGLVASAWGVARYRTSSTWSKSLPLPEGWIAPDAGRSDPQGDYENMLDGLRRDDWALLKEATPWQWMLALLGILDSMAPQALQAAEDSAIRAVYEYLRLWQWSPAEPFEDRNWAWPYDGFPTYEKTDWKNLLRTLEMAVQEIDLHLGFKVLQVQSPTFRRHRDDNNFTDSESQQWTLSRIQYTGLGAVDSVARVQFGSRRLATWTEVRRVSDSELLSIHTLDDKLGRWWYEEQKQTNPPNHIAEPITTPNVAAGVPQHLDATNAGAIEERRSERVANDAVLAVSFRELRASQKASLTDRGSVKCESHVRIALMQWCVDESYSHPLAEAGMRGMGMPERALAAFRKALASDSVLARTDRAAVRGKEHAWGNGGPESTLSWPEHRRQRLLERALDACKALKVDILVLPEVSIRRETVAWLEIELQKHHPGLAVLAGTYRHFGRSIPDREGADDASSQVHPLMAPLTLLWRPDEKFAKVMFGDDGVPRTLRFARGKKYRAVAANELFRPEWKRLAPLFTVERLLGQLGLLTLPKERLIALLPVLAEQLPPLRFCMELICSELFLLTSPANIKPLQQEVAALLRRFPSVSSDDAAEIVRADVDSIGDFLSIARTHSATRRTILLVPAATTRSNDYWHAGQASVLASGAATVFCNAAESSIACGGSCFIGIDSATKPHLDSPGLIETLTPYHGWRKGILTARADGALSKGDQALVVVDIDPVHVVTGKPRPQLLPEPMALVAYLPIVETLDPEANKLSVYQALLRTFKDELRREADEEEVISALAMISTAKRDQVRGTPDALWTAFERLRSSAKVDGHELDHFADLFGDPKAVRERLLAWERDRHQQPNKTHGPLALEPAWLDFLEVDLTLKPGAELATVIVPPWDSKDD